MDIWTVDLKVLPKNMKKWCGGALIGSLFILLVLRYVMMKNPIGESSISGPLSFNTSDTHRFLQAEAPQVAQSPETSKQVISADILVHGLFVERNFSDEVQNALRTWINMKYIINNTHGLPNAAEAIREAGVAWDNLMNSVKKEQNDDANGISLQKVKEKQCPYFLNKMNATEFGDDGYRLQIPCGLIQGSSMTVIGIPNGHGNFQIEFTGESLPKEANPSIILHYNVRLHGDKISEHPVIVQNTWTSARGWGEEERCPSDVAGNITKVDELDQCNQMVGKDDFKKFTSSGYADFSIWSSAVHNSSKSRSFFPFRRGYPSVMTLRAGEEGIHMTVDGKHVTSFAYRERLEPWLANALWISGELELISVLASGLPTSEDLDNVADLGALASIPISPHKLLDLFIGVFSTANNFKRRMAVRKTWMQYPAVRSGVAAVRFFVGLHKNQMVNEKLWKEVQTYGDIQLMPFVDYYGLITWKTVAICSFGTQAVSAKYIMKTDDDSFVRVDELIASLRRVSVTHGLLYGLISPKSQPHRNSDSKWFISLEEWSEETYPPWAHGPGYIVSCDIAKAVYKKHKRGRLKMFKLEDVAMGIWIEDMKKGGLQVRYKNDARICIEGCRDGYVVAHYQSPRQMLCLWQKLQEGKEVKCCK